MAAGWILLFGLITCALLVWQREAQGRRRVARLVGRAGLPPDRELVAATEERFARQQVAVAAGAGVGYLVGAVLYGLFDRTVGGAVWCGVSALVGEAVGSWLFHLATLRSKRTEGRRAAVVRPRRLLDFLTPLEVAVQYGLLVLPLLAGALGVLTLTGDDHPRWGWALVAAAGVSVAIVAGVHVLQRWALQANQPAAGELELRWEEALRAAMLRELSGVAVCASWLLGGLICFIAVTDWPIDYSGAVRQVAIYGYLVGTLVVVADVISCAGRKALSRSQQAIR